MGFSEKDKLEAKRKSNFRCCICEKIKPLEIHHIIPENGKDTDVINNAVPLCADCHDTYGENQTKQKWIKEKRDHWYNLCSQYYSAFRESFPSSEFEEISEPKFKEELLNQEISIYHHIFNNEGFEKSAKVIFDLVRLAQKEHPTKKRVLYLDIEGHKNKGGGYDSDMFELQKEFILGFLLRYLSKVYIPLITIKNNKSQVDNIPEKLMIFESEEMKEYKENDTKGQFEVYAPK